MERLFFREHQDNAKEKLQPGYVEQMNIAVTGLSRSVGTTFVASALAFYFRDMGKNVTFVQCLEPSRATSLLYDAVAMDQRFVRRQFHDVYERIRADVPLGIKYNRGGTSKFNREADINWILPTPSNCDLAAGSGAPQADAGLSVKSQAMSSASQDSQGANGSYGSQKTLSGEQQARLVGAAKGEVCVFDFEADYAWDRFLMDMDLLVVVVDPLPSKLIRSKARFKTLKKLELAGCKTVWIVNQDNPGVNRRQVRNFLKTSGLIWMPAFPAEEIYQSEYACRFVWENEEIRKQILEIFTKVSPFQ